MVANSIDNLVVKSKNNHTCLICLCETDGEVLLTRCGHFFHKNCFKENQSYSGILNTCPYCRQNIFKKSNLSHITQLSENFEIGQHVYVISTKISGKMAKIVKQSTKCVWVEPLDESWEGGASRVKKSSVVLI
jgi:hypothetical protein